MGAVTGMLGLGGGAPGPQGAAIINPVKAGQTDTAYTGVQNSMQQQQALLQALQAQQGLQNQSNVYNQLQGVVAGQGPNPAQAMLNQATGQNVANQAALMAGQRGAGANAGLIARQAAQQGGNLQQQAVGQGATMQAQQALNALGQAGNLATTQAGQQIGQANTNAATQQAEQQALLNATQGVNTANVQNQASINAANSAMAQQQQGLGGKLLGGALGGLGTAAFTALTGPAAAVPAVLGAGGGGSKYSATGAEGGAVENLPIQQQSIPQQSAEPLDHFGPKSSFAKIIHGKNKEIATPQAVSPTIPNAKQFANGGKVPALVSPGEKYLSPADVQKVEKGANPLQVGETIPGKPKVKGAKNSYANDTVPKTLEEGGIVLPRSVTQAKHPHWAAHAFVKDILSKKGKLK